MSILEQRITLCGRQTNPLFSEKLQQGQMKGKAKACAFEKKKKERSLCRQTTKTKNKPPQQESIDIARKASDKKAQKRWDASHTSQVVLHCNKMTCIK